MSNKLTQAVLPLILLFSSGVWTAEETLDITLPAWSTDSVYGDNTVYEINLTQTALTSTSETGVNTNKLGGVYFEPFAKIPSPGDKRCHDNDCNYYLDISGIWIQSIQRGGQNVTYNGVWGGGYKGTSSGGESFLKSSSRWVVITPSSKVKIKKDIQGRQQYLLQVKL